MGLVIRIWEISTTRKIKVEAELEGAEEKYCTGSEYLLGLWNR